MVCKISNYYNFINASTAIFFNKKTHQILTNLEHINKNKNLRKFILLYHGMKFYKKFIRLKYKCGIIWVSYYICVVI